MSHPEKVSTGRLGMLKTFLKVDFVEGLFPENSGRPVSLGNRKDFGYLVPFQRVFFKRTGVNGFFAILHPRYFRQDFALKNAVVKINRKLKAFQIGFSRSVPAGLQIFPSSLGKVGDLKLSILNAVSSFNSYFDGKDFQGSILPRKESGHIFAVGKKDPLFSSEVRILLNSLCLFWIIYIAWLLLSQNTVLSGGITKKVITLFLFAVGLPAFVLLVVGFLALDDRVHVLQQNLETRMRLKLKELDSRFPIELRRMEKYIAGLKEKAAGNFGVPAMFETFLDAKREPAFTNLFLFNRKNQVVFKLYPEAAEDKLNFAMLICGEILKRLNKSDKIDVGTFVTSTMEDFFKSMFGEQATVDDVVKNLGKFLDFSTDKDSSYFLIDAIYGTDGTAEYCLVVLMTRLDAEKAFFRKHRFALTNQPELSWRVGLFGRFGFVGDEPGFPDDLPNLRRVGNIAQDQNTTSKLVIFEKKDRRLWIAQPGQKLKMFIWVAQTLLVPVENEIARLWGLLGLISVGVLLGTAFMGTLLSRNLLTPIGDLRSGIESIQKREFRRKIPVRSSDELGQMANLMNHVIVGMDDLAVARIIQEQLFPGDLLEVGQYRIYGKSRTMVDVGGDYFDYEAHGMHSIFGLLGDVSGHGVSAALIMGMAKCFFTIGNTKDSGLADLLLKFHQYLIQTVKKEKMMTLILFRVNIEINKIQISNGGQTFPLHFSAEAGKVEPIEIPSFPLGVWKRPTFKNIEVSFNPGDAMFFYSDGLSEAKNSRGEDLGYIIVQEWFQDCARLDSKKVVEEMFRRHDEFTMGTEATDDLTMICLKRSQFSEKAREPG